MARIFCEHTRVAVAFCSVEAVGHDASKGFIPAYRCRGSLRLTSVVDKCRARGMARRAGRARTPVQAIGGFDELLGPGARFPDCEDGDLAVRALLFGHEVYETTPWPSSITASEPTPRDALSRRNWLGIGAAYAKRSKSGHWRFAVVPLYELLVHAIGRRSVTPSTSSAPRAWRG